MQPLFDPDPFLVDDIAIATLRAFVAPDGSITRYEIVSRTATGNLHFTRFRSMSAEFDSDGGYVMAEAHLRDRIREIVKSSKLL